MSRMLGLAALALLLFGGWAALSAIGSSSWSKATLALHEQPAGARAATHSGRYDQRELEGLPARNDLDAGVRVLAAAGRSGSLSNPHLGSLQTLGLHHALGHDQEVS